MYMSFMNYVEQLTSTHELLNKYIRIHIYVYILTIYVYNIFTIYMYPIIIITIITTFGRG